MNSKRKKQKDKKEEEEEDLMVTPLNEIPKEEISVLRSFIQDTIKKIDEHLKTNPVYPTATNNELSFKPQLARLAIEGFTVGAICQYKHNIVKRRKKINNE
jgi:hypothetical protein